MLLTVKFVFQRLDKTWFCSIGPTDDLRLSIKRSILSPPRHLPLDILRTNVLLLSSKPYCGASSVKDRKRWGVGTSPHYFHLSVSARSLPWAKPKGHHRWDWLKPPELGGKAEECVNEPGPGLYPFWGWNLRSVEAEPETPVSDPKLNKKRFSPISGHAIPQNHRSRKGPPASWLNFAFAGAILTFDWG